jgi:hypothetical protein
MARVSEIVVFMAIAWGVASVLWVIKRIEDEMDFEDECIAGERSA